MINNDGGKPGKSTAPNKAITAELKIETIYLFSFFRKGNLKTPGRSDSSITPDPFTERLERPTSPDIGITQYSSGRVVGIDNTGAAVNINPPNANINAPPLL